MYRLSEDSFGFFRGSRRKYVSKVSHNLAFNGKLDDNISSGNNAFSANDNYFESQIGKKLSSIISMSSSYDLNLFSENTLKFMSIHKVIGEIQNNHEDDDLYLEWNIGERAKKVLILIEKLGFPPPKIIVEDSDEFTFSWLLSCFKYYIVVTEFEVGFIELDRKTIETNKETITCGEDVNELEFNSFFASSEDATTANIEEFNYAT